MVCTARPDISSSIQGSGGDFENDPSDPIPGYVRLTRAGDWFTAYYSADGETWNQLGNIEPVEMSNCAYVGIATCSRVSNVLGTASYNDFVVLSGGE